MRALWTLGLAGTLALSPLGAGAAPAAIEAGPPDPLLAVYVRDLGALQRELGTLRAIAEGVGLGDYGFEALGRLAARELGFDPLREASTRAAGLDPGRGVALFVFASPELNASIVFGVSETKAAVSAVDRALRSVVDPGYQLERSRRKGGPDATWRATADGQPELAMIVRDGLAHVGPLAALAYAEGAGLGAAAPLVLAPSDGTELGVWMDLERFATLTGSFEAREMAGIASRLSTRMWTERGALRFELDLEGAPQAREAFALLAPRYVDARVQTAAIQELRRPPALFARLMLPARAIYDRVVELGVVTPAELDEFRRWTGLELERDVLDVFPGDLTFIMPTGLGDARLELSTLDAARTRALVLRLFGALQATDAAEAGAPPKARRTLRHGESSFVSELPIEGVGEWIVPRLYWSLRGGRLVIALTPGALEASVPDAGAPRWTTDPVVQRELETPSLLFVYADASDVLAGAQDLFAWMRAWLGPYGRAAASALDVAMLAAAAQVDSVLTVQASAQGLSLRSDARMIALEPSAALGTPSGDFAAALRHLYRGHVEAARRAMWDVARTHPATPEGRRADRYVFESGSLAWLFAAGSFMAGVGGAMSSAPDHAEYAMAPEEGFVPVEAADEPPRDPCLVWAELVCVYLGPEAADCKRGQKLAARKSGKFTANERRRCALDLYELRGY